MNYYEIFDPYYALIKAKDEKDAVKKYIEIVAGDEDEFDTLLNECEQVPEYYASAKFAQSKGENGEPTCLDEVVKRFKSNETEILLIDGSLI